MVNPNMWVALFVFTVFIDIYQDRFDSSKSIVVIDKDGEVATISVSNKDLNDTFINKVVSKYEHGVIKEKK
jgi:uncharacterized membrane-anchored protein YitT (DUF2179 family)